jgi:hypothetical protein
MVVERQLKNWWLATWRHDRIKTGRDSRVRPQKVVLPSDPVPITGRETRPLPQSPTSLLFPGGGAEAVPHIIKYTPRIQTCRVEPGFFS